LAEYNAPFPAAKLMAAARISVMAISVLLKQNYRTEVTTMNSQNMASLAIGKPL
jgi:hypothetical protein